MSLYEGVRVCTQSGHVTLELLAHDAETARVVLSAEDARRIAAELTGAATFARMGITSPAPTEEDRE